MVCSAAAVWHYAALERDLIGGIFGGKGLGKSRSGSCRAAYGVRLVDLVIFAGLATLRIHRAHSRLCVGSEGGLWVVDQAPGIYSMEDVLGFHT